ncbi:MAG: glycosyltransferase family 2 protein [Gammaproteobacteria bacterium]
MHVAALIPAYNEAATIAAIARQARAHTGWVIVVDDGSSDGTAAQLAGLDVTVLRQDFNQGKAAALQRGFVHALEHGAEAVITLDADGQHDPTDIPRLIEAGERHPRHIVIGARLANRKRMPRARRFGNAQADFWISWAAGYPIRDTQSGFRLYPSALLHALLPLDHSRAGFVFESEMLIEAVWRGFYIVAVPIATVYPEQARGSYYRPLHDTARIARMVARRLLRRRLNPLALLRALGLVPPPD